MNTKKLLLGTSALVAAAVVSAPSFAGSVGSEDSMSVTLGGEMRFQVVAVDQDVSAGNGRGYGFSVDETEIFVEASNTADNGMMYGVSIELNAGGGDGTNADEVWAFIDSPVWGRVEMGDQDDATDRMFVEGDNILVGRAGPDGDAADYIGFGTGRAISATGNTQTGDATKVIYFTPRFGGFQLGASLTPDTGEVSGQPATLDTDNDGDFENVIGLGANWEGKFDDVSVVLSLTGEFGDSETASGANTEGDLETIAVGGIVTFGAFGLGAGYVDFADFGLTQAAINAGADAGAYWSVGGSYKSGPYGVSLNYFQSSVSNAAGSGGDTDVDLISLDVAYTLAPGWDLSGTLYLADAVNINATAANVNQDATAFIITNQFNF
jgi:outer membrane protein OmpU